MGKLILDQFGRPLANDLPLNARFDLAQTTPDNRRHWEAADSYSARAALSPAVRKDMRERSRLEAENSSYYAGILSTATNHVVGTGPRLQVTTENTEGNRRLEQAWLKWAREINLTTTLRVAFESYWRDGESFLRRHSRRNSWPISLNVIGYESEQVQNPYTGNPLDPYTDDGVRLARDGSGATEYFFLDHHPTDPFFTPTWSGSWESSDDVIHLFRPVRFGQIRGIPRAAAGLPLLAVMRRFTMATVHAAESAALHANVMKTTSSAVTPATGSGTDFATIELERNMATILPEGWDITQIKPEHPATTHEMFERQLMIQFCRCMNIPFGLAAGTSKDSNFSSHKGDIRNLWQSEVWNEQEQLDRVVMSRVFGWFLEDAVLSGDLLDGMPPIEEITYQWFWDGIPALDETDSANAKQIRMKSGQSTPDMEWASDGYDFGTAMSKADATFNLPPGTYKQAVLESIFPGITQRIAAGQGPASAAVHPASVPVDAGSSGVYTEIGQRSFNNNMKRIRSVLDQVISGDITEGMARVTFQTIGLDSIQIESLLADVADGRVDTPELQEVQA